MEFWTRLPARVKYQRIQVIANHPQFRMVAGNNKVLEILIFACCQLSTQGYKNAAFTLFFFNFVPSECNIEKRSTKMKRCEYSYIILPSLDDIEVKGCEYSYIILLSLDCVTSFQNQPATTQAINLLPFLAGCHSLHERILNRCAIENCSQLALLVQIKHFRGMR